MSLVMLVEDEAVLRTSMARSLRRLPGVDVVEAGRMDEARALIHDRRPSVIVSDLSLPDGSGVDLLSELESAQLSAPVLFVTAYLGHFRELIPQRPDIEVFEKPMPMDLLRRSVQDHIARAAPAPSPFTVIDYLQLAGMGRRSVVLRVLRGGRQFGRVAVRDGEPWSARAGGITGVEAVRRLAFGEAYTVEVQPLTGAPGPRTLTDPMDHLLLEVCRVHDEGAQPPKTGPLPSVVPAVDAAEAPPTPAIEPYEEEAIDAALDALETGEWALPTGRLDPVQPRTAAGDGGSAPSAADALPAPEPSPAPDQPDPAPTRSMRDWVPPPEPPRPATHVRSMRDWVDEGVETPGRQPAPSWRHEDSVAPPPPGPRSMRDWVDQRVDPAPGPRSMRDWIEGDALSAEPVLRAQPLHLRAATLPPAPRLSPEEARFDRLLDDGLDALLSRDYGAAWRAFSEAEAVRPGNPVVRANLARIRELGQVPEDAP